jgi:hypothetical protein
LCTIWKPILVSFFLSLEYSLGSFRIVPILEVEYLDSSLQYLWVIPISYDFYCNSVVILNLQSLYDSSLGSIFIQHVEVTFLLRR